MAVAGGGAGAIEFVIVAGDDPHAVDNHPTNAAVTAFAIDRIPSLQYKTACVFGRLISRGLGGAEVPLLIRGSCRWGLPGVSSASFSRIRSVDACI